MNVPLDRIQVSRLIEDLWQLVNIPSPSGRERQVAFAYADLLARAGATVEVDESNPDSPSVIGHLRGNRPGKTLQLAGHLDHIDVPHAAPVRSATTIAARGVGDMKGGLAGILEIVRVLVETGCDFPGNVLVTAYGLHEAPIGDSSTLIGLIKRGVKGDAAIVTEQIHSTEGKIVLEGKGQAIWNVTVQRDGEACHELNYPLTAPDLFSAALAIGGAIRDERQRLSAIPPRPGLLSAESLFIGQMHYGDFYNRMPVSCTWQGTRRWNPDKTFADVQQGLCDVVAKTPLPNGISASVSWRLTGESFALDPSELIVTAQRQALETLVGGPVKSVGIAAVADTSRLIPMGGVPTILSGFDNEFAHADHELVRLDRLPGAARLLLLIAWNYLHQAAAE
jgi:acetylornithine deacetylase/succinyl-diaminopimelate desuccinylase-like protein